MTIYPGPGDKCFTQTLYYYLWVTAVETEACPRPQNEQTAEHAFELGYSESKAHICNYTKSNTVFLNDI